MGLLALSSVSSHIVPQDLQAKSAADEAPPQEAPTQSTDADTAGAPAAARSNYLSLLPANIALQLKQQPFAPVAMSMSQADGGGASKTTQTTSDTNNGAPSSSGAKKCPSSGPDKTTVGKATPPPNLNTILHRYQVEDDGVKKNWELPWPYSMFMDPITVTDTEAALIMSLAEGNPLDPTSGPRNLSEFKNCEERAFAVADERFPPDPDPNDLNGQNDNHNDAFRHAYWSALLTRAFGPEFASAYTAAHEGIPGNEPAREAMDLYNDKVGILIAKEHPDASPEELADLIEQAIRDGKTVVIDENGNLAWSDQVPEGKCGHPQEGADPLPGRPVEDFIIHR